mgnify:CR=1 FL=1
MKRKIVLLAFTLVSCLLFIFQLMALQLFNSEYSERSLNNAIEKRPVYPTRGLIYDRNGKLLVSNQAAYDLMIIPISNPHKIMDANNEAFCAIAMELGLNSNLILCLPAGITKPLKT